MTEATIAGNLPGTMVVNEDGVLEIGGINVRELAREYGTPVMVLDEKKIRDNIRQYRKSFQENYHDFQVVYAGKAMLNKALCKIIEAETAGLDVVSGGEFYTALQAGFPMENVFFHGNNKLKSELEMALENNTGRIVIDNFHEFALLQNMAVQKKKRVNCLLRITPGIEAHTHEYIKTGQADSKFGVGLKNGQALQLIKKILEADYLNFKGLHAHIGSQIFNLESFNRLIDIVFEFCQKLKDETGKVITELNLGGGLGISYVAEENPPSINEFVTSITTKVKEEGKKHNYPLPRLIVEPGRSIIGDAGTTIYRVGSIKAIPGYDKKYIAVDGGMTDNIRPALYDSQYRALAADKCFAVPDEEVTIAGKCCESGDILIKNIKFPKINTGELIAIPCTAAYSFALSNNYNKIPRIPIVLVNEGCSRVIVKRESYSDLIKNEVIPEDLC